jgi:hypothetical protein
MIPVEANIADGIQDGNEGSDPIMKRISASRKSTRAVLTANHEILALFFPTDIVISKQLTEHLSNTSHDEWLHCQRPSGLEQQMTLDCHWSGKPRLRNMRLDSRDGNQNAAWLRIVIRVPETDLRESLPMS